MNLILLEPSEVGADGRAVLSGARARHAYGILKAKPGDRLRVGVVDGPKGEAVIEAASAAGVELRCALGGDVPPRPVVDLLLALPRPKVMRRLWAQLAALGVGRIILANAWKVEKNYFDTHVLDAALYRPLLVEGLQQAGDTRLPEVSVHKRFKVLVEDELDEMFPSGLRLVADPSSSSPVRSVLDAGAAKPGERGRVLLAVGPEGGWVDYEIGLLEAHGFRRVGMGPRVLRTDTACVGLLALVHDALGA